jgi:hypothetical protein
LNIPEIKIIIPDISDRPKKRNDPVPYGRKERKNRLFKNARLFSQRDLHGNQKEVEKD